MTTDPEHALVRAVLARLAGDGALTPWLGTPPRVHAEPPAVPTYPYLTVSRTQSRPSPWQGGGSEILLTVSAVTRYGGADEARAITGAARRVLEAARPELLEHRLIDLRAVYADVFAATDQKSSLGVLRLRAVTEPAPTATEEAP